MPTPTRPYSGGTRVSPEKVKEVVGEHYKVSNIELLDRENIRPEVTRARAAAILLLLRVARLDRGKIQDKDGLFCSMSEIRATEKLEREDELFYTEVSNLEYLLSTGTTDYSGAKEKPVETPQAEPKKRPVPEVRAIPLDLPNLPRIVGEATALPQLSQKDSAVVQKIFQAIKESLFFSQEDIRRKDIMWETVDARKIASFLLCVHAGLTKEETAEEIDRSLTLVNHNLLQMKKLKDQPDSPLRKKLDVVCLRLGVDTQQILEKSQKRSYVRTYPRIK